MVHGMCALPGTYLGILGSCSDKGYRDRHDLGSHLVVSLPTGGLSGATIIDSLDTLYLMELKEEFQEAKAWVQDSFHLNVVSQRPLRCEEPTGPVRSAAP